MIKAGKDEEQEEYSFVADGNANGRIYWKTI